MFKTDLPESDIFDIPDVCGENTNSFFKDIPITQARCDFEDGGGWTVILRRNKDVSEQVDFNLPWTDYERGFGDLNTEFWYGLRNIHCLTNQEEVELQIEVRQEDGTGQVWTYGYFVVDEPENNYTLHIGQAQGPSSDRDSMDNHNGIQFTTKDRDHDENTGLNCADDYTGGGWWYKSCGDSVLTGGHSNRNIYWGNERGATIYFSFVEMKLRPKRCKSETPCNEIVPPTIPQIIPPNPPTTIPPTNPLTAIPPTIPLIIPPTKPPMDCGGPDWTRIAYLNVSQDPGQSDCPSPWIKEYVTPADNNYFAIDKLVCLRNDWSLTEEDGSCASVMYSNSHGEYSQVCGRITGYQDGITDGFHMKNHSIDTYYVDGISITHGQSPRQHIWTFAAAFAEVDAVVTCPCGSDPTKQATVPPFVGNNYFCETAESTHDLDPLWDGEECSPRRSCECTLHNPPWFKVQLTNPTNDDIEVRNCGFRPTNYANIGIELIELYVK